MSGRGPAGSLEPVVSCRSLPEGHERGHHVDGTAVVIVTTFMLNSTRNGKRTQPGSPWVTTWSSLIQKIDKGATSPMSTI